MRRFYAFFRSQQSCIFVKTQAAGPGARAALTGHLVMLDLLSGGDECRVSDCGVALGIDDVAAVIDETGSSICLLFVRLNDT